MARFLAALLAAAAVLAVQAGQMSHAAPSTSELFWRAMLPNSAMPDAILRILRPDTSFRSEDKSNGATQVQLPARATATLAGEPAFGYDDYKGGPGKRHGATTAGEPAFGYDYYKGSAKRRHGAATAGEPAPFSYDYKEDSGKRHGATAEKTTPFAAPYNYGYKGSATKRHCATTAGETAAPFNYSYKGSDQRNGAAAAAKDDEPFKYGYHTAGKDLAGRGVSDAASTPATRDGGAPAAATTTVFFHEDAVRVGRRLPFYFPPAAPAALGFLPRRVADSIPFSTARLPAALALLGVAPGSAMAARMGETLTTCESPPLAGEAKFCATSAEALAELAVAALGTRDVAAVTSALPRAGAPLRPYTVRAVRRLEGSSFLACHDEAYPYTVYWCHTTGAARAYMLEMEAPPAAGGGAAVTVATVCHTNTSQWNPEHVSFRLLGTKPGGAPVCHLMPYGHILWVKNVKRSPA